MKGLHPQKSIDLWRPRKSQHIPEARRERSPFRIKALGNGLGVGSKGVLEQHYFVILKIATADCELNGGR